MSFRVKINVLSTFIISKKVHIAISLLSTLCTVCTLVKMLNIVIVIHTATVQSSVAVCMTM